MQLIFLLGAGRSGTTLLYKLLSLHPEVGYISNYDERLPQWISAGPLLRMTRSNYELKLASWFKKSGNAYSYQRSWQKRIIPTPVEGESVYQYCGLPLNPPADYELSEQIIKRLATRFERLYKTCGCTVFISKRTANNRRIQLLDQAFPQAKFINLMRDGRDVAHSLSQVIWWQDHLVWWACKTAAELEEQGIDRLELCSKNWVHEVEIIEQGLANIEASRILNVRYETLISDPLMQLKSILTYMGLPCDKAFISRIDSLGLTPKASAWQKKWTQAQLDSVSENQAPLLQKYGYIAN